MLAQTLKIVSSLIISLLVGITVTFVTDRIENSSVEKKLRKSLENNIRSAIGSFNESAASSTSTNEKTFVKKFVETVLKDKVFARERVAGVLPEVTAQGRYLFTLRGRDYTLDLFIQEDYLRSELAILDVPDYLSGITATIIVFTSIVLYGESKKRAQALRQQFEEKHAELNIALRQHEALALLGRMSAALAHELKTPIATISNLVQAFPSRQTDEQFVKRFVALMHEELNRTQQLIDNLLAYGKEIDIRNNEWVESEVLFRKTAVEGLNTHIPQQFLVLGDKFYLDLLFKNLIRNSREAGADTISVHVEFPKGDNENHAEIIYEDNGAGFSPGVDLEKLTDPFVTSRSRGGGLGLYLAKKIVTAHDGVLSLYRREKGAGVRIILPEKRIRTNEERNN